MATPLVIIIYKDVQSIKYYTAFSSQVEVPYQRLVEKVYDYIGLPHYSHMNEFVMQDTTYFLLEMHTQISELSKSLREQGIWMAIRPNGAISHNCPLSNDKHHVTESEDFQPDFNTAFANHIVLA